MNGFLWLGIGCTAVLLLSVLLNGIFDGLDALDIGPGWLSLPVLAAFLGAFGFVAGATVEGVGALAVVPGAAAGLGFGWLAARLSRAAMNMPTDPVETEASLLGSLGRVVTPPAADRYGEVLLSRRAGPVKVACVAKGPLPPGTEVVVVDVTSSTLVTVEAFDPSVLDEPGG